MGDIGARGLGLGRSGGWVPHIGLRPAHPAVAPPPSADLAPGPCPPRAELFLSPRVPGVQLRGPLCRLEAFPSVKIRLCFAPAALPSQKGPFASEKTSTE